MTQRRSGGLKAGIALGAVLAAGAAAAFAISRPQADEVPRPIGAASEGAALAEVTVYKSPTCGCCAEWVEHLRANGFGVTSVDTDALNEVKARHGVAAGLASCHTAVVDEYVIEGHVPADLIAKLLEERPEIAGLAVPGMPMGSPGMEGPRKDPYDVLAFDHEGNTRVYASR